MNEKTPRLGRGLAALIGDMAPVDMARPMGAGGVRKLPVAFIVPNRFNPRKSFNDAQLEELTQSIREKGVMQPLLVRPTAADPDQFELIAGERRWRAAQKAGLHEVPVIVREVADKEALELAIIENVQRADLNPLEEAMGYEQLIAEFSYSQNELADVIGKSRSHVANTLRLLKLPAEVRALVDAGELTAGHARTLITAEDPLALARQIVSGGLSVRAAEALAQNAQGAAESGRHAPRPRKAGAEKDADTLALEKQLSDRLGLAVSLQHGEAGGQLAIGYTTLEQLDALCQKLLR